MDADSPFAGDLRIKVIQQARVIHVNFCDVCHYVWKAPSEATTCINCKGNGLTARSLVSYETEVPIT